MDRRSVRVTLHRALAVAVWLLAAVPLATTPSRAASAHSAGGKEGAEYKQAQFAVRLGYRRLNGDTWEAAQGQSALGFEGDWRPRGSPVWPEFALNLSADTVNDLAAGEEDGVVADVSAGVKRYFFSSVRPYVGGGIAWVYGRQDRLVPVRSGVRVTESDRETTYGWYVHAGVSARFGTRFHWGLDVRALRGTDVKFFDRPADLDYDEATLFVGFAW